MKKVFMFLLALLLLTASFTAWAADNWTCPNCGATNGPSKAECWQCGVVKEGSSGTVPAGTPAGTVSSVAVGDYVTFGNYPQSSSGTDNTPIEWLVLDVKNGKALLISKYALDSQPYNSDFCNVTWETCTLRSWLNGPFYNSAFSSAEKAAVLTTTINNGMGQGPDGCADGGCDTEDNVFLLSNAEVKQYFRNDSSRRCVPTGYAKAQGAKTGKGNGYVEGRKTVLAWWLRSPGWNQRGANIVYINGEINLATNDVSAKGNTVRPAVWVDLSAAGL